MTGGSIILAILGRFTAVSNNLESVLPLNSHIVAGNSVTHANAGFARVLSGLLGIVVPANTAIGITCHPLSVLGVGGNHW